MIEVRSGLESDPVLTAEIKAASETDSLARMASELPFPILRISPKGHILYVNAQGSGLARQTKMKLGDMVPNEWLGFLKQAVEQSGPVSADWKHDGKNYFLKFVSIPDSYYVSVIVRDASEDYREEYRDPLTGLANRVLFLDRLRQVISLSLRNDKQAAIHVIRLQHFNAFSETLGVLSPL